MRKQRPERARKLNSGHFAFMRAVVQGLDAKSAWDRYLRIEGEHLDARKVRSTIAWIRAEFAAAARRQAKPGTARLVLIDVADLPSGPHTPTLEEFALARGMENFSHAEQRKEYAAEYGAVDRRSGRRQQLVRRQLDALRWLEEQVAQDPQPGDGVGAWLSPALAMRIERAGMPTLFTLIERINGIGSRWWAGVPGIGETKALRIVEWLVMYERSIGMPIGTHALTRRTQLQPAQLEAVVSRSTSLVPIEKFVVPSALDGSAGRYRGPIDQCMLEASNDHAAILAWLASKRAAVDGSQSSTQRSYRKEAERILLWAILEREKALSSLSVEDAGAFMDFLAAPPARWCGSRYHQRWSPLWRPLEGPLSPVARRQTVIILRSMFAFLVEQNYMVGNPFGGVALPREGKRELGSRRTLTFEQWDFISAQLAKGPDTEISRRRARAIRWLYATGMRLAEIVGARCEHLERVEYRTATGKPAIGWLLEVEGKGQKIRKVPLPAHLVDELASELAAAGKNSDVRHPDNIGTAILAKFDGSASPAAWSASGLYKSIRAFMNRCALQLDGADAAQVLRASTHWLRHTHASHALNGREGHAPVPLQYVQNNLGHSSIATTSGYLTTERDAKLQAMEGFWGSENS